RRAASVAIGLLSPNPDPLVKTPMKVLGGLEQMVVVRDQPADIPVSSQRLRDGLLLFRNRTPTRGPAKVTLVLSVAVVGERPEPRVNGASETERGERLRISSGHPYSAFGEPIEVWGLDPRVAVRANVIASQRVDDDENDIHPDCLHRALMAAAGISKRGRRPRGDGNGERPPLGYTGCSVRARPLFPQLSRTRSRWQSLPPRPLRGGPERPPLHRKHGDASFRSIRAFQRTAAGRGGEFRDPQTARDR